MCEYPHPHQNACRRDFVLSVAFSPDDRRIVSGNDDRSKRFKPGLHEVDGTYFVFELSQPFRYGIG
jgi:WD40 repeat protein